MSSKAVWADCKAILFPCSLKSSAGCRLMAKWHGFLSAHVKGQTVPGHCVGMQGWGWLKEPFPHHDVLCPFGFTRSKATHAPALCSHRTLVLRGTHCPQIHLVIPPAREKSTRAVYLACVLPLCLPRALEELCVSSRSCPVHSWMWGCCHLQSSEANTSEEQIP